MITEDDFICVLCSSLLVARIADTVSAAPRGQCVWFVIYHGIVGIQTLRLQLCMDVHGRHTNGWFYERSEMYI